jgi:hypothetical protein
MAGAGNLEVDLVLALELDFSVVQAPGGEHNAVQTDQSLAIQPAEFLGVQLGGLDASLHGHSVDPRGKAALTPSAGAHYTAKFLRRQYTKILIFLGVTPRNLVSG